MEATVSHDNQQIARIAAASFGGDPKVHELFDQSGGTKIAVLSVKDTPEVRFTSYCTIGLSDYSLPGSSQPPLGSEICGVSEDLAFENVLATAAFGVMKGGWLARPGAIFPEVVSLNIPTVSVPNLLLVSPPYLWDGLEARVLTTKTVGWLLGVPVTDPEMDFALAEGSDALEDRLDELRVDISNLNRESAV